MKAFIFLFFAFWIGCTACTSRTEPLLEPEPQRFREYFVGMTISVYEWKDGGDRWCTAFKTSDGVSLDCDWRTDVQATPTTETLDF